SKFDFTHLKTYRIDTQSKAPMNEKTLVGQRVHHSVKQHLNAKGYQLIDTGETDFVVRIEYWEREYVSDPRLGIGVGVGQRIGKRSFGTLGVGYGIPRVYEEDTLAIRIFQSNNGKEIWQGVATGRLDRDDPQKSEQHFVEVTWEILKNFPPEKK